MNYDLSKVRPGDVCFQFRPWNVVNEIIAYYTFPVDYNGVPHHLAHAETILDTPKGNIIHVMSADAGGMTEEDNDLAQVPFWIIKSCDGHWGCPPATDLHREEIIRWMYAHKGMGYNFTGLLDFPLQMTLDEKHRLYCSQSVFDGYELDVDDYFSNPKCTGITLLDGILWVSPAHLYTTRYLHMIAGSPA